MKDLSAVCRNIAVLLLVFAVSCAPAVQTPIPHGDRVLCVIDKFQDQTGVYDKVHPSLEQLLREKLKDDYTFKIKEESRGVWTIFVVNQFLAIPEDGSSQVNLVIEGEVEQIKYGRPQDINIVEAITAYWALGIFGLAMIDSDDEDKRATLLEYRITIRDSDKRPLKTLVIQSAFEADVTKISRDAIVDAANRIAAEEIAWELNNELAKILGLKRRWHTIDGSKPNEYPSALWGAVID